jgi:hypothetical protein
MSVIHLSSQLATIKGAKFSSETAHVDQVKDVPGGDIDRNPRRVRDKIR